MFLLQFVPTSTHPPPAHAPSPRAAEQSEEHNLLPVLFEPELRIAVDHGHRGQDGDQERDTHFAGGKVELVLKPPAPYRTDAGHGLRRKNQQPSAVQESAHSVQESNIEVRCATAHTALQSVQLWKTQARHKTWLTKHVHNSALRSRRMEGDIDISDSDPMDSKECLWRMCACA